MASERARRQNGLAPLRSRAGARRLRIRAPVLPLPRRTRLRWASSRFPCYAVRALMGYSVRTGAASERVCSAPQPRLRAPAPHPRPRSSFTEPKSLRWASARGCGVRDWGWSLLLRTADNDVVQNPPHFFPPCRKETRWSRKERGAWSRGYRPLTTPVDAAFGKGRFYGKKRTGWVPENRCYARYHASD